MRAPNSPSTPPPAYQFLTAEGYAWAASSYRRNSYDPGIGVIDTKNLTRHMQSMLRRKGDLDKTYLTGISMGGHVTAAAIEKYPSLWDGAMPACGVVGDVELFDYFLDYNVGAAAIAGLAPTIPYPAPTGPATTVPTIHDRSCRPIRPASGPAGWHRSSVRRHRSPPPARSSRTSSRSDPEASVSPTTRPGTSGTASPIRPATSSSRSVTATAPIANRSGTVSQNTDMTYLDEYGIDIDDHVLRVARRQPGPQVAGHPAGTASSTARPSVPVLSIHTTGDLFVPIEMEQLYAQEVIDNGLEHLLVQRSMRDVGHCSFTDEELVQSYTDLFAWVETGVKPAGEDLIGDISSPTLGCDFTTGTDVLGFRFALEPCPPG